jgi:hypothetical protein
LVDDILPPVPPGAEKGSSGEKAGLFSKLFKKKVPEQMTSYEQGLPEEPPKIEVSSQELGIEEPGKINSETLDDIRKQLGLENKVEIPEPPRVEPEKAEEPNDAFFNPVNEEKEEHKPALSAAGKVDFTKDIEEPPKIIKAKDAKDDKTIKKSPDNKLVKTAKSSAVNDWDDEIKQDGSSKKSSFDLELTPKVEQQDSKPKAEFLRDVNEREAKDVSKGLKRKAFEDKKNIQYNPEIMPEEDFAKARDEKPMLEKFDEDIEKPKHKLSKKELKAQKIRELNEKKELKALKLKHMDEEEKSVPILEKKSHDFTEEPVITKQEPEEEAVPKPELELIGPEPEKLLPAPKPSIPATEEEPVPAQSPEPVPTVDVEKLKDSIRNELRDEIKNELKGKMKDKIREEVHEEERALIRKEYSKKDKELETAKDALAKERQVLEQEKISVAGVENRYNFKEKQLLKDKELVAKEHASLKKERKQFEADKEEADDLIRSLPMLRKDHEKLSHKMMAYGEQVKLNMKLEENLKRREEELSEAQKRLEETETRIKEQGFSDYLQTELKGQSMISTKLEEGDVLHDKHLALYNLIDECKSLVFQKKIDEAKAAYMRIREEYKKGRFREEEKDSLYTTIRELYDDINLAAINP